MILLLILPLAAIILVIYSLYWFTKEFFNSCKAGIRMAQALTLIVIGSFSYFLFSRASVFFKSNIIKTLNENQLALHHDFTKVSSHNPGFMVAGTAFTLEIDPKDRLELLRDIRSSKNFRDSLPEHYFFEWEEIEDQKVKTIIIDSENSSELIREVFFRDPYTYTLITVSKNTNKLTYEKE